MRRLVTITGLCARVMENVRRVEGLLAVRCPACGKGSGDPHGSGMGEGAGLLLPHAEAESQPVEPRGKLDQGRMSTGTFTTGTSVERLQKLVYGCSASSGSREWASWDIHPLSHTLA